MYKFDLNAILLSSMLKRLGDFKTGQEDHVILIDHTAKGARDKSTDGSGSIPVEHRHPVNLLTVL